VPAYYGDKEFVKKESSLVFSEYKGHPSIAKLVTDRY